VRNVNVFCPLVVGMYSNSQGAAASVVRWGARRAAPLATAAVVIIPRRHPFGLISVNVKPKGRP
jgi:hypothetical protein